MSKMHDGAQAPTAEGADHGGVPEMLQYISHLMRMLRKNIRGPDLDKDVGKATSAIPDARGRLNCIANIAKQATTRVPNAIDAARPAQDTLGSDSQALINRWRSWIDHQLGDDKIRESMGQTNSLLHSVPEKTRGTNR